MEQFRYRTASKIVSIVELVLLVLSILAIVGITTLAITLITHKGKEHGSEEEEQLFKELEEALSSLFPATFSINSPFAPYYVVLFVLTSSALVAIELVAAFKLFKASRYGADPEISLKHAKFWRAVVIILAIIEILGCIIRLDWQSFFIIAVYRGITIFIGWKFINELTGATGSFLRV